MAGAADPFRANKWAGFILGLAALYNLVWGGLVVLAPEATLRLAGIERASPIALWRCIGMLVGVYGVAYWIAASDPRRHRAIVLVGLLGKVLGPLGALSAVSTGTLPRAFLLVNLTNDLIWLGPFGWVLWRFSRHDPAGAVDRDRSLYQRIMGRDFDRLGPVLRAFHGARAPVEVRGVFRVERGASRLANWLADRAGFPRARSELPVHLRVTPGATGELWQRSFAGVELPSRQWDAGGLLAERFGPLTLFMAARTAGASLEIADVRATLLGIPLAPFLSPRISAGGTDEDGGVRLRVRVSLALVGKLVEYGGLVRIAP